MTDPADTSEQASKRPPLPDHVLVTASECNHCRRPIVLATYAELGRWEPDYDPNDDPRIWRHSGTGYAGCMIGGGWMFAAPLTRGRPGVRPDYVYVASSWRNPMQPAVCATLAAAGIEHYDFRNPAGGTGFSWREVKTDVPSASGVKAKGSDWEQADEYLRMVAHPRAIEGFEADFAAMKRADTFVLVLPCGKSAHLELGWAVGAGKRTAILLEDPVEPELMYRMVDFMTPSVVDLLGWLGVSDSTASSTKTPA